MKPNDKAIEAGVKLCWDCPRATPSMIRDILTAAYAAQFPTSEDYRILVNSLRDSETRYIAGVPAADAIEAVLAERDELKAENNELRKENENIQAANRYGKDWVDQASQDIACLRAERDALLARLAPEDDEALVEIVGRTLRAEVFDPDVLKVYGDLWAYDEQRKILKQARAAIAAIRPHIEAAERERCAKIAEKYENERANYLLDRSARAVATLWREEIAAAIRSGK